MAYAAATRQNAPAARRTPMERAVEALIMFLVGAVSLFVLVYVGFGDGKRNLEQMHLEQASAQGSSVVNSIEKFVRDGLPLKQYAGFSTLAAPILESEEVDAIAVYDTGGRLLFSSTDKRKPNLQVPTHVAPTEFAKAGHIKGTEYYQIWLPLKTRFESVGGVVIYTPISLVTSRVINAFAPTAGIALALSLLFALAAVGFKDKFFREEGRAVQVAYALTFLVLTAAVIGALANLYYDGVQRKAKASAETMAQRLSDVVEFGIKFRDIEGLDRSFGEYRRLNPEISKVALVIDGAVQVASPPESLGKEWRSDSSQYEYRIDLKAGSDAANRALIVTVPRTVIYQTVLRSVKNFLALFVASAFLSGLFLQVGGSLRYTPAFGRTQASHREDISLVFIKPVFFLAVFFDSLTYSFLPKFMQEAAVSSHLSVGYASAPFTAYYLAFALSLIPAGTLSERYGPKLTTLVGLVFAALGVMWLSFPLGIFGMTGLRAAAGLGQGMILIGVQSYILKVVPPDKKTQGAGIIVFGFQAGLISGMALGSLLVNFLEANGVFMVAGGIAITALVYTALLVPEAAVDGATNTLLRGIKIVAYEIQVVARDVEFLNTLVCIGIPAKAVLTGVITFAIPLVLGQYGYRSEDIGQIVMLYGLGVVLSSAYVSKIVDRTSNSGLVLLAGAVLSGTGLSIFGLLGSSWFGNGLPSTVAISVAVTLVGVAHGFINAPVTTHVAHSQSAAELGSSQVMTVYRFVERVGHVAGPIILSQLFLFLGQGPNVIAAVGIVIALLGVAFVFNRSLGRPGGIQLERA